MVNAIIAEIALRAAYLEEKKISSVYFGGGTPSLLTESDLEKIFSAISKHFTLANHAEITLEANPDDLDVDKVKTFREFPINRLSIGIQSFHEKDLKWMNRAHSALEARVALDLSLAAGFENITIDLIYGSPTTSDEDWEKNLALFHQYKLPHLSSYALTVEPGTALGHWVAKEKIPPMDEVKAARQFAILQARTESWGMEQYEISNFALPDKYAVHNTNYWRGTPYLGLGPAAHSFAGQSRQWNISHNAKYMKAIAEGVVPAEKEELSQSDQFNEYIMVSLRTQWGISQEKINTFDSVYIDHFHEQIAPFLAVKIKEKNGHYCLLPAHRFFADGIAAALFYVETD